MLAWILSLLGLGGLGALAYFVGPGALLGLARGALGFLAKIPWQAYAAAALIGLIAFLAISRGGFMERAHAGEARIAQFCQVVRIADHNTRLDCNRAEAQVEIMGQDLSKLTDALNDQSARVRALAAKSAEEQQQAAQASKIAEKAAGEAEAANDRLRAAARSAAAQRAPGDHCESISAVKDQWK